MLMHDFGVLNVNVAIKDWNRLTIVQSLEIPILEHQMSTGQSILRTLSDSQVRDARFYLLTYVVQISRISWFVHSSIGS